jgi:parallel beta-helix repeat protein
VVFPICSRNGTIEGDTASGTDDAALYVGNSHDIVVEHNHVTDSTAAIVIENSTGVVVDRNTAIGNSAGIVAFALPGLRVPVTQDVLIEDNFVVHNDRPNPVPPDEDVVGRLPTGSGILSVGADRIVIRGNVVTSNDSWSIAVAALPIPNPTHMSPAPDHSRVRQRPQP